MSAVSDSDTSDGVYLDTEGRIADCGEGLNYSFRVWRNFTAAHVPTCSVEDLQRDCDAVDARTNACTFWLPASKAPRTALEALAAAIFKHHTATCGDFDKDASGMEWWAQHKPSGNLHWDQDVQRSASTDIHVYPHISTVTYLTHGGSPTVVFEGLEGPGSSNTDPRRDQQGKLATSVCVCHPTVGKHMCFDGRFLHGAVATLAGVQDEDRTTFLVNIWLNHQPLGIEELPDDIARTLCPAPVSPALEPRCELDVVAEPPWPPQGDPSLELFDCYFGVSGDDSKIEAHIPVGLLKDSVIGNVALRLPPWCQLAVQDDLH